MILVVLLVAANPSLPGILLIARGISDITLDEAIINSFPAPNLCHLRCQNSEEGCQGRADQCQFYANVIRIS